MRPRACAASIRGFQLIGRAIGAIRRERQNAVVPPIALAGKVIDRHQLNCGDPKLRQSVEFARNAGKAAQ
jgi:hypothetical protein